MLLSTVKTPVDALQFGQDKCRAISSWGGKSLQKKNIDAGKSGILNCSCDFIREIKVVRNGTA